VELAAQGLLYSADTYSVSGKTGSMRGDGAPERSDAAGAHGPDALAQELRRRARQQQAVARLGQRALRERHPQSLFQEVVTTVAEVLAVDLCVVLKLREDGQMLDVVADVGHADGPRSLPAGTGTQAGYALQTLQPVVTDDLSAETRFDARSLCAKGMVSGVNSIIEGVERPFGVLSAHTRRERRFSADDINFLVAVANLLSAAVERDHREHLSRHAAMHDPLTGLANRNLALDRLDLALARRRRDGTDVAMIVLDVDRFRVINDSLGHSIGDQLLVALAARLTQVLRPTDTIARLSGDEFAIVCESRAGLRQFVTLAERVGEAIARPVRLDGGVHHLTASVGVAVAHHLDDTSEALLRDADAAMYRAKARGGGHYELFDPSVRTQVLSKLRVEQELRHALRNGQLQLHYQPIIEVSSGLPVATEALLRWAHPSRGLVPPLEFIAIAEETGLIVELGRHVLEVACAQASAWQAQFRVPLQMYVNVSARQLNAESFARDAASLATRADLRPGTLGLEVTESVFIEDLAAATRTLSALREHGFRLLLDDFGTGYSSLSYLRTLPLDGVKIDRAFVDGLDRGERNVAIFRAIVEMCDALRMSVVGEGVESAEQLEHLAKLGCQNAQGFLLCRPQPAAAMTAFLSTRLGTPAPPHGRSAMSSAQTLQSVG
jgi:diguanylate cyclase (GGDEF)-like protein